MILGVILFMMKEYIDLSDNLPIGVTSPIRGNIRVVHTIGGFMGIWFAEFQNRPKFDYKL